MEISEFTGIGLQIDTKRLNKFLQENKGNKNLPILASNVLGDWEGEIDYCRYVLEELMDSQGHNKIFNNLVDINNDILFITIKNPNFNDLKMLESQISSLKEYCYQYSLFNDNVIKLCLIID